MTQDSDNTPKSGPEPAPRPESVSKVTATPAASSASATVVNEALTHGIGGKRGLFDSTLPTAVFLIAYVVSGSSLSISLWAAVGTGAVVMAVRIVRGESLRQVLTGFVGVAISAVFAARTGEAQNFFLPGLLLNLAYGAVFVVSIVVRRPLAGYAAGAVTGDVSSWLQDPAARRAATQASWIWAGVFGLRLVVQLPLFFAGAVGALGVAKIVMGVPLFLLGGLLSYRILRPAMSEVTPMISLESREDDATKAEHDPGDEPEPDRRL